jgi:hypothetical protein
MVPEAQRKERPTREAALQRERRRGMKEMALKRRIAVLVLAALLSVCGASVTAATFVDQAHAWTFAID